MKSDFVTGWGTALYEIEKAPRDARGWFSDYLLQVEINPSTMTEWDWGYLTACNIYRAYNGGTLS